MLHKKGIFNRKEVTVEAIVTNLCGIAKRTVIIIINSGNNDNLSVTISYFKTYKELVGGFELLTIISHLLSLKDFISKHVEFLL